jgi:hypothetical protein
MSALSACGAAPSNSGSSSSAGVQAAGFEQYVTAFEQNSAQYGAPVQVTDLTIRFGQVDASGESRGRGVCEYSAGSTPTITISQTAWESSTESEREELVFHELGHCVLHKTHQAGITEAGIPQSLMNPAKIDGSVYSKNKAFYLSKLFR